MVWIGAIRFVVTTGTGRWAGTDTPVRWLMRRGQRTVAEDLFRAPDRDDLARGSRLEYVYSTRETFTPDIAFDATPAPPPGQQVSHPNHPPVGAEFSSGLAQRMSVRIEALGDDLWTCDRIQLAVKYWRQVPNTWVLDAWSHVGTWSLGRDLSTDLSEAKRFVLLTP